MSIHKDTAVNKFKAVVLGCRSCGNQRRFIVTEDEAGYVEAQFVDNNDILLFAAYDLSAMDAQDGGRFSQSLDRKDINSLRIFPLSAEEVRLFKDEERRARKPAAKPDPFKPLSSPKINLSKALGGAKR